MRVLLDSHILLAIVNNDLARLPPAFRQLLAAEETEQNCSTASLWEIAIKVRLGKLALKGELALLDATCSAFNLVVLPVLSRHVLTEVAPEPDTRDPFDRLLLAQASVECLMLVTLDGALAGHPLAWQPPT